jgi:hypothetical protein
MTPMDVLAWKCTITESSAIAAVDPSCQDFHAHFQRSAKAQRQAPHMPHNQIQIRQPGVESE